MRESTVAVPGDGASDLRAPGSGPVAGGELPPGEAGALVGFGVGCLPDVLEATAPVTTHVRTRTYVWRMLLAAPGTKSGGRSPEAALVQHNIWWAGSLKWIRHTYVWTRDVASGYRASFRAQ
jgi:hypothetical protein